MAVVDGFVLSVSLLTHFHILVFSSQCIQKIQCPKLCADFLRDGVEMLAYAQMFDDTEYDSVHNAMIPEPITWTADHDLPPEVQRLDSATMFICDPTKFVKVDPTTANPQWYEPESGELFIITTESEICPAGLKSRLALHAGPPKYYVIILCPPAVTQTPGQPKMYGTLDGRPLANSRPDSYILPITPLTTEITMNLQVWAGMKIDQLRDRTLSVYIGRYILHIQAQKYISSLANIAGSRSKAEFAENRIRTLHHR